MRKSNNEKEYRVIIYEHGRPTDVYYKGTKADCEIMRQSWEILNRDAPYYSYCSSGIDEVRYDEDGFEITFAELRDEYDHCYEMGDFDY